MSTANPAALTLARESRGLRQGEVVRQMSALLDAPVSQGYLSKAEAGRLEVSGERLDTLAAVLQYPADVLCEEPMPEGMSVGLVHHRKRASIGAPALRCIHARLSFSQRQVSALAELAGSVEHTFHARSLSPEDTPAEAASEVRAAWGVNGGEPIIDLVAVIEAAGAVVLERDLATHELDAVSQWSTGRLPVVLLNEGAPGDRMRFSVAHELGHLILHGAPGATVDQERQADEFASEFLMPANAIRQHLRRRIDIGALVELKSVWGTSMAALARRGWDLNALSDWQYRNLMIEMSVLGYRSQEPVITPAEIPSKIANLVASLIRDRGFTPVQLAATAGLLPDEFDKLYRPS